MSAFLLLFFRHFVCAQVLCYANGMQIWSFFFRLMCASVFLLCFFFFVWKCAVKARHSNAIIKFSTRQITGRSTISGIGWFAMQISCKFLQIQKSAPFKFFFLTKIELNLNEQCDAAPPPLSELLLILLSGVEPLFRSLNPRPWASKCSSTNQIISERLVVFFCSQTWGVLKQTSPPDGDNSVVLGRERNPPLEWMDRLLKLKTDYFGLLF